MFFCYSLRSFATLCPIPPYPTIRAEKRASSVGHPHILWTVQLCRTSYAVRHALHSLRCCACPTRKAWGISRNLGKDSGEMKSIKGQRVPYPFCILCDRQIVGCNAASAFWSTFFVRMRWNRTAGRRPDGLARFWEIQRRCKELFTGRLARWVMSATPKV